MCLIDWQVVRYCSPVLDLLYYIFSATDKALRAKEFENLLRVYHTALTKIVKKLGSDPQKLFGYDELLRQVKKFGKYSLVMSPLLIQIMLADAQDISNMDELSQDLSNDDRKPAAMIKGYDEKTQILYNERIQGLLSDVIKFDLYWQ